MFFKKQKSGLSRKQDRYSLLFLPFMITIMIVLSSCSVAKGSILILENMQGTGCEMEFKEWSSKNKSEIYLRKGDALQVVITCESGEIDLTIKGENGSKAYTGNGLESGEFTVTISESDTYVVHIEGKKATGNLSVKKIKDGELDSVP